MPDGYVSEDLQWGSERVRKGFDELLANGFANRCETTKWVWVRKHFEWNPPENPNQVKSAAKVASQIPDECSWKPVFMRESGEILGIDPGKFETVSEPFQNPSLTSNSNSNSKQEKPLPASGKPAPDPKVIDLHPEKPETEFKAACRKTLNSFQDAYEARYGARMSENAKVYSQIQTFCKRIGKDEAPLVAGWFPSHPNGYYAQRMHSLDCLVKDAEKLRTEWVTKSVKTPPSEKRNDPFAGAI